MSLSRQPCSTLPVDSRANPSWSLQRKNSPRGSRTKGEFFLFPTTIVCIQRLNRNRKGAFNFAKSALPLLLQAQGLQHPPTLIFTGATASVKGSANFAAFATGKFALRALAQSLAREFGPKGVHVSHVIIDGVIDIPRTKAWTFEHEDAKLDPDAVRCFFLVWN